MAEVTGGNMSMNQPVKVTETHVIIYIQHVNLVGLLKTLRFQECPIRAQVLLFCNETEKHKINKLHVHLLPENVPVEEVLFL